MGEDFAGDVALEAAHDLGLGLALGSAASHVVLGGLVAAHEDQRDQPQGAVGLVVAAAVQPVPVRAARRHRYRGGAAEPGEGCFGAEPAAVVPGGDQWGQLRVEVVDFRLERLPAAAQNPERGLDGRGRVADRPGRKAAHARICCLEVSLRSGARTCSGAVRIRASI